MEWSKPLRDVLCVAMADESRLGRGEHRPVRLLDVADVRAARITLRVRPSTRVILYTRGQSLITDTRGAEREEGEGEGGGRGRLVRTASSSHGCMGPAIARAEHRSRPLLHCTLRYGRHRHTNRSSQADCCCRTAAARSLSAATRCNCARRAHTTTAVATISASVATTIALSTACTSSARTAASSANGFIVSASAVGARHEPEQWPA